MFLERVEEEGDEMALTAAERRLRGQMGAYTRWSHTDSQQASQAARKGWQTRYGRQVDPGGTLAPEERERLMRAACSADLARMRYAKARKASAKAEAAPPLITDCSWCARDEQRAYTADATDRICKRHHAKLRADIAARRARRAALRDGQGAA